MAKFAIIFMSLFVLTQLATCADIRQKRDAAEGDEATTEAITDLLKKKWDEVITDENLNKVKNQLNLAGEQAKDLGEKLLELGNALLIKAQEAYNKNDDAATPAPAA